MYSHYEAPSMAMQSKLIHELCPQGPGPCSISLNPHALYCFRDANVVIEKRQAFSNLKPIQSQNQHGWSPNQSDISAYETAL